MRKIIELTIFILSSYSAAAIGSFFTALSVNDWYKFLNKPSFNPPSWVFGPVWTILYFMMGVSAYLVWQEKDVNFLAKKALVIFFIHLIFNTTWSICFFGLKNPMLAFVNIIILLIFIAVLFFIFLKINKLAAYLLIPYFFWVSFATVLNYSILRLN